MAFIEIDLNDFNSYISLLDEKTKDENIHEIIEKGLSKGFELQQSQIKSNWTHENTGKDRKNNIQKEKTINFLLHSDKPLWNDDYASLGVGFLFDNSIDPRSRYAQGGIIAQYLAYGTKNDRGSYNILPDQKLKAAIVGKAIKDKTNKIIEDTIIKEIEKIFDEL